MKNEEFYDCLLHSTIDLKDLFERYTGESFSSLNQYVIKKTQSEFTFPNDNPEFNKGFPLISGMQINRLNIFCRTLEEGHDYTPEAYQLALRFVTEKESFKNWMPILD